MTEQKVEVETIVRQGNTILIAHTPLKKETNYWDVVKGFFKSDSVQSTTPSQSVPSVSDPALVQSVPIVVETASSEPVESKEIKVEATPIDWSQYTKYFSRQSIASYKNTLRQAAASFDDADVKWSNGITKFKEDNLISLGDVRVRSILMAFSSAILYKVVSINTTGFLRKTRNLGLSFVFMGYWFVPELFNPFLRKPSLARNII